MPSFVYPVYLLQSRIKTVALILTLLSLLKGILNVIRNTSELTRIYSLLPTFALIKSYLTDTKRHFS